jgi:hypothetical protein
MFPTLFNLYVLYLTIMLSFLRLRVSTDLLPGYFIAQSLLSQQVTFILIAQLTTDNVASLLEVLHKYEIPTLGNDIGVCPPQIPFMTL